MTSEELFQIDKKISRNGDEVIVSFVSFSGWDDINRVDAMMFDNISEDIGRYDGHEVNKNDTDGRLFAYGINAEVLFKLMRPILLQFDFLQRVMVYLRFNNEDGTHSELEFRLEEVA